MAFWLTSDTSSQAAIVASIEPELLEVGVGRLIGQIEHDDDRIVPEPQRTGHIVDVVVFVFHQSPLLDDHADGVPRRFFQAFQRLSGHYGTDIRGSGCNCSQAIRWIRTTYHRPQLRRPKTNCGMFCYCNACSKVCNVDCGWRRTR